MLFRPEDRMRWLEDNLTHARDELARQAQAKDAEMHELRQENAVLKKGIAIQNARQREAYEQNAQLQEVLARAAEHMAGLERTVQMLQARLAYAEGSGTAGGMFSPPRPPPDVF